MFELHKDEKVIMYIRRHWIFLFLQTKLIFLIFLAPVILVWVAQIFNWVPDVNLFGVSIYSVTDILVYLWGLFCWMLLAEKFTDYALDFWVVTNKRIIESEMIKLFDVQLSTLELQDIEDITVRSEGVLANLIGYGKLEVQTAGATNEFFAENIMNPAKVQSIIFAAKLSQKQEEQDIEKEEMEQISTRIFREEQENTPLAQLGAEQTFLKKEGDSAIEQKYDWAMIDERQAQDKRNVEEVIETIEDKYKTNVDKALRSGE
jgi:hypothetical protein